MTKNGTNSKLTLMAIALQKDDWLLKNCKLLCARTARWQL